MFGAKLLLSALFLAPHLAVAIPTKRGVDVFMAFDLTTSNGRHQWAQDVVRIIDQQVPAETIQQFNATLHDHQAFTAASNALIYGQLSRKTRFYMHRFLIPPSEWFQLDTLYDTPAQVANDFQRLQPAQQTDLVQHILSRSTEPDLLYRQLTSGLKLTGREVEAMQRYMNDAYANEVHAVSATDNERSVLIGTWHMHAPEWRNLLILSMVSPNYLERALRLEGWDDVEHRFIPLPTPEQRLE